MATATERFEFQISPTKRLALEALAAETERSTAALVKLGVDWVLARRALFKAGLPAGGDAFADVFVGGLLEDIDAAKMADGISSVLASMEAREGLIDPDAFLNRLSKIVNSQLSTSTKLIGLRGLLKYLP